MKKLLANPTNTKGLFVFCLAITAALGSAQAAPPSDMSAITDSAATAFKSFLTANAPSLITIILLGAGIRFVFRLLKKGIR